MESSERLLPSARQALTLHGGFWMRAGAYMVDGVILGVASFAVYLPLVAVVGSVYQIGIMLVRDISRRQEWLVTECVGLMPDPAPEIA